MSEKDSLAGKAGEPGDGFAIRLYPVDDGEHLRLEDIWSVIAESRWLIAALAIGLAAAAVAASFLITPVYRAQVLLAPVAPDRPASGLAGLAGQFGGIAALAGMGVGADDNTAKSIAILRSRDFTQRFIRANGLMQVLFADIWDPKAGTWTVKDPGEVPDDWRAFEKFDQSVRSISRDTETGLVTLTIDWTDPAVARDWANALVRDVNAEVRGRTIEQSRRNIEFLQGQLSETDEVELRTAVYALMESEMKNAMLATVRSESAFEVIDPAVAPQKKSWPNRGLLAALGFATGLTLGIILAFLRRAFRPARGSATRDR